MADEIIIPPELDLTLDISTPSVFLDIIPPELDLTLDISTPSVNVFDIGDASIRYFLIITGTEDSTTDIEIPLKSFQSRRRTGKPTFLSVVIPSLDYVDEIENRSNGRIQIQQGYEKNNIIIQRETIIETYIETISVDEGGKNQSITLTGYTTMDFSTKSITLTGSTYKNSSGGRMRYRLAKPYIYLNPGDTVTIDTDTFVVDTITYVISVDNQTIEIDEA